MKRALALALILTGCTHDTRPGREVVAPVETSLAQAKARVVSATVTEKVIYVQGTAPKSVQAQTVIADLTVATQQISVAQVNLQQATTRIDADAAEIAALQREEKTLEKYRVIVWTAVLGSAAVLLFPLALKLIKYIP